LPDDIAGTEEPGNLLHSGSVFPLTLGILKPSLRFWTLEPQQPQVRILDLLSAPVRLSA